MEQAASEMDLNIRHLQLSGHVGFDSLPDLVTNSSQNGYTFNILCVGETGLGKSTLINSLFNTVFDSTPSLHNLPAVKIKTHSYELQEKNVKLKLTIVETVGYGDQINKSLSVQPISDYIDSQFEMYLQQEMKTDRCLPLYRDTRVHACLYFISPTGHGLKALDLACLKSIATKVNVIPIIAKADTISKNELVKFKNKIMAELHMNQIQCYVFPMDDEVAADTNANANSCLPLAVVGSTDMCQLGGRLVRCRQYPWGSLIIENENHCDFIQLRELLIRNNMEDLREITHQLLYENYRKQRLEDLGVSDDNRNCSFYSFDNFNQTNQENFEKEEYEMRQKFIIRVQEKELELKERERELAMNLNKVREEYGERRRELEEAMAMLDDDISELRKRRTTCTMPRQVSSGSHYSFTLKKSKKKWSDGRKSN